MPKSYRIRTTPGSDKSIKIELEQDFEFLEILSLKINGNKIIKTIINRKLTPVHFKILPNLLFFLDVDFSDISI